MKVKIGIILLLAFIAVLLSLPAIKLVSAQGKALAILPMPQKTEHRRGSFSLGSDISIDADQNAQPTADYLAQRLRLATGYKIPITLGSGSTASAPRIL